MRLLTLVTPGTPPALLTHSFVVCAWLRKLLTMQPGIDASFLCRLWDFSITFITWRDVLVESQGNTTQRAIWFSAHVTACHAASEGSECTWFDLSLHQVVEVRVPAAHASRHAVGGDCSHSKSARYSFNWLTSATSCVPLVMTPGLLTVSVNFTCSRQALVYFE